ncbi:amidase [Leifsonia aquatica]|uniref:amidase n=1 Tax=Leifsonia aquatica TaxID=144185 RepID=UPI00381E1135
MSLEPWEMSAGEIAEAVRTGSLTATAVVEAHLRRIDEVNPRVNALTVVFAERALALAADLDRRIAAGEDPGPLAGVPISVKENIDMTWSPTTEGATFLQGNQPADDATAVRRMLAAGAIPIGRGNMPDFGLRWDTDNDLFGRTLNPWVRSLVPEGSSGGDAVAVATGMAAIGLGNDYGGSLRLPANAAGVTALRTSAWRIPAPVVAPAPVPLSLQHFAVNGPIARSAADLDLAFAVLHGADERDPLSITVEHPRSYDGPRRVAVVRDPLGWGVAPSVVDAVEAAASALTDAGWQVDEVEPPMLEEAAVLWRRLSAYEMKGLFAPGALPAPLSDGAVQYFRDNVVGAEPFASVEDYADAWAKRVLIAALWHEFFAEHPIILGPVATAEPFPIGYDLDGPEAADELWRRHRLVVAVNFLGLPSAAVPTHVADSGSPVGVQLIADRNADHVALAAAADVERALGRLTPTAPRW